MGWEIYLLIWEDMRSRLIFFKKAFKLSLSIVALETIYEF